MSPRCGSQVVLCDYPIRMDFYQGCTHDCEYCFTRRKLDNKIGIEAEIENGEGPKALRSFINGARKGEVAWCDWDIPIHVGGLSDPFQPYEKTGKIALECLKVFAETGYPFIISTKGDIYDLGQEYVDLISKCNVCFQVSLVSPNYDKLEQGAPPFKRRLEMLSEISQLVPRTIVRVQPYMITELDSVLDVTLPGILQAGVHGITIEGMKFFKDKPAGTEASGSDYVYKEEILKDHFGQIRDACHFLGLGFWSGENRLRYMGDSLGCCGCDDLPGFKGNHYNLNHIYAGENPKPTPAMCEGGSGCCYKTLQQTSSVNQMIKQQAVSFKSLMDETSKSKFGHQIMGGEVDIERKKKRLF